MKLGIEPIYFFIALSIGLFFAYISTPQPDIIIKYPTPDNAGKVIYKDKAEVCYKYKAQEVSCPSDKSKIKTALIQNGTQQQNTDAGKSLFDNIKNIFSN